MLATQHDGAHGRLQLRLVGGYLAWRNLPEDGPRPGTRPRLDVVGMLLLSPGIAAVIYGLTQLGGSEGFASLKVALPLIAGLVLLVGQDHAFACAFRHGRGRKSGRRFRL